LRDVGPEQEVSRIERLEEENRSLREILENLPVMVFVKDANDRRFLGLNVAGEALLGVSRDQFVGKLAEELFPADQAATIHASDDEAVQSGRAVEVPEEPIETSRGTRWITTRKVPVLGADGLPKWLVGIVEDITERREAEEARARALQEADEATRELESFSYSVAHDLRAPLRSLDGFSQALVEDYHDLLDDEGRRYLGFIRGSAQRMAQLIDDLLSLSRVTRAELAREPVDLTALVRSAAARVEASDSGRRVEIVVEDGLACVGDPRLLAVVFDNLLNNAWKFTGKRADARIEVGAAATEEGPAFYVRDNGAGFDMAYADKLFGVFQRLHAASDFDGTGVGLATVQRIVRRHGGRAWAQGEIDRGSTFFFTLGSQEPDA